jgi:hypothetical protein
MRIAAHNDLISTAKKRTCVPLSGEALCSTQRPSDVTNNIQNNNTLNLFCFFVLDRQTKHAEMLEPLPPAQETYHGQIALTLGQSKCENK